MDFLLLDSVGIKSLCHIALLNAYSQSLLSFDCRLADYSWAGTLESSNLGSNFVKQISKQDAFGIFTSSESKNCPSAGV